MLLVFAGGLVATYYVYRAVPSSFVPEEDEGYFITIVQAPAGASLEYTTNILKQAEAIIQQQPEVLAVFSIAGFSFSGAVAESGPAVLAVAAVRRAGGPGAFACRPCSTACAGPCSAASPGALVIPVAPPAIQGLSTFGGFQFQVLDGSGGEIATWPT